MQTPKPQGSQNKKGPNPQNFKIVKCKYWEKGKELKKVFLNTYMNF